MNPITRRTMLRLMAGMAAGGILAGCKAAPGETSLPVELSPQAATPSPRSDPTALPSASPPAGGKQDLEFQVLAEGLDFPEGPAFDPQGSLWCTELGRGTLVKITGGGLERLETGGKPNSLAFDRLGRAWVCDSQLNQIRRLDLASQKWETLLEAIDGAALQTPNDLCFDPFGNLLFTCPNFASAEKTGYVVCLSPSGKVVKIAEGLYRPNGIEIVDGGKALVVADTFQKTLFKGEWDGEALAWRDYAAWAVVGGSEGPDGMAFGADGLLYQAVYGDGVVRVVDPGGAVAREIPLLGKNPTNVAVDPSGALGIVVTETEKGQLVSFPGVRPGAASYG